MTHDPRLSQRVTEHNRKRSLILLHAPKVAAALAPLLGQKVVLKTGDLSWKLKQAVAPIGDAIRANGDVFYRFQSQYSLTFCFGNDGNSSVAFGKLADGVLVELYEFNPDNYKIIDFEEVRKTLEEIDVLKEKVRQLESKVCFFL